MKNEHRNRNKIILILIILILIAVLICFYYQFIYVPIKTVEFIENKEELVNPSRGFYIQISSKDYKDMAELRNENVILVFLEYDIKEYVNDKISNVKLEELKSALTLAKSAGLKVIFRAAYGFDSEYKYKDPNSLAQIKDHIGQISPILNSYSDVILCVQAGFLGPWGEWHSSNLLGDSENIDKNVRNTVLKVLLEKLDDDIIINVRRPRFLRDAIEAGLDASRLGLHNDALLSTDTDMGTYDDALYSRVEELKWAKSTLGTGVNGGEMPQISEFTQPEHALMEFSHLQLTYLNKKYNKEVLEFWNELDVNGENAYDYINNHLGYRFYVREIKVPEAIKHSNFKIKVELCNSGFAPIEKGYQLYFVIKDEQTIYTYPYEELLLHTLKSDNSRVLEQIIKLPKNIKGNIEVGLKICQSNSVNSQSDLLAIELANDSIDYVKGVNYIVHYSMREDELKLDNELLK